jgi:hypothetical protein
MWISKLAVMAILLVPTALVGQQEGDRVRLWVGGERECLEGILTSSGEELEVFTDSGNVSVPALEVQEMRVRTSHGHAATGALVGFGVGAVGGMLAVESFSQSFMCTSHCPAEAGELLAGAVLGGVVFAGIGALVGYAVHRDEVWEPIDGLAATIAPVVNPAGGAVALNVSVPVR